MWSFKVQENPQSLVSLTPILASPPVSLPYVFFMYHYVIFCLIGVGITEGVSPVPIAKITLILSPCWGSGLSLPWKRSENQPQGLAHKHGRAGSSQAERAGCQVPRENVSGSVVLVSREPFRPDIMLTGDCGEVRLTAGFLQLASDDAEGGT